MTYGESILDFYKHFDIPQDLPAGVEVLFPFSKPEVWKIMNTFYKRFYNDNESRVFLIGINPGRFGAGITGLPFTDPIRLKEVIGIENPFDKKAELSSKYIYDLIDALGGPEAFYSRFYFTSVSPVGFVKDGKNLNYYDIPALQNQLEEYMLRTMQQQIDFNGKKPIGFSLGKGKNFAFLQKFNKKYDLFERVDFLPHPRWVMQYRLKKKDEIIAESVQKLNIG